MCCTGVGLTYCLLLQSSLWVVMCVAWLMPVETGERKCDTSSGYNSILGICVNYYGRIMWIFCTYMSLVLLCI